MQASLHSAKLIASSAIAAMLAGACAVPRPADDGSARVEAADAASARRSEGAVTGAASGERTEREARSASASRGAEATIAADDGPPVSPRFERFELVSSPVSIASASGDRPGNSWGGHQTRVLRLANGDVYTAYLTTGATFDASEWHLARRSEDGWQIVAGGLAGREPVNILRTSDSGVAVMAWPKAMPVLTTLDFSNGSSERRDTPVPGRWEASNWPYNAAGIGLDGTLCVLQSHLALVPGAVSWACRSPSDGTWEFRQMLLPHRYCYAFVLPEGRQLTIVAVRDVLWSTLGYAQPAGAFNFAFNESRVFSTPDYRTAAPAATVVREEVPTPAHPEAWAHASDSYRDDKGRLHVIYALSGQSTAGVKQSRHALLIDGRVAADVQLPEEGYWRITQDSTGAFWALYGTGGRFVVYPATSEDGMTLGPPTALDLRAEQIRYSGMAIAVPRAGVPLDDFVDGVFPSGRLGERWVYFRLRLR